MGKWDFDDTFYLITAFYVSVCVIMILRMM